MATLTPSAKQQFFDANGNPLAGGKLYTYAAGTTTPLATYTDAGGGTPNTNPVILNSRGEANVWLGSSKYKFKLTTSTDVEIWTVDNLSSYNYDVLATLAASGGSALVGFLQSGIGAAARTVQNKLRDIVSVKDFGAVGDGITDDSSAIQTAISASDYVFIPYGTYAIGTQINITNGKTVVSENASFNYTNVIANKACIVMESNTNLFGTISITMPDGAAGQNVNHLRVGGGDFPTDGAHDVQIGTVYVYGGHNDMAAVLVEGDSYNVYIEEVNCPGTNNKIGQVFGCHWGNFQDHYLSGGAYVNVPGGAPTTHPRNVRLDRLIVGKLTNSNGISNCAAFISSSRDVKIGYVYVEEAAYAVTIFPGDQGFAYASADVQVQKMYGIQIDTIVGNTRQNGLYVTGSCPYPAGNTVDNAVEFTSNYVNLTRVNPVGASTYSGISIERTISSNINSARITGYDIGIGVGILSRNVNIKSPYIKNTKKQGIVIAGTLGYECVNVNVFAPYIENANQNASTDAYDGAGIAITRLQGGCFVGGIVGTSGLDTQYVAMNVSSGVESLTVENIKTYGSVSNIGFVANSDAIDQVSFINCSAASGMTLRSGGIAAFMLDQRKVVYGLEAPIAGAWVAGDLVLNRDSSVSGLAYGWQCISSGTPGTWRVVGQRGVRAAISNTPEFVGQVAVVSTDAYMAIGTSSSADWKKITP